MACCTIPVASINANKRSHDYDLDWEQSPSTSSSSSLNTTSTSSSSSSTTATTNKTLKSIKRRRCGSTMYTVLHNNHPHFTKDHNKIINTNNNDHQPLTSIIDATQQQQSIFQSINQQNQLSNSELLDRIRNEAKRYIRRHQINIHQQQQQQPQSPTTSPSSPPSSPSSSSSSSSSINCTSKATNSNNTTTTSSQLTSTINNVNTNSNLKCNTNAAASQCTTSKYNSQILLRNDNIPLFTIAQVSSICEKMVKERENRLVEQYDTLLRDKLNEQYDIYLRFTHELVQRNFENSQFTYVS